MSFTISKLAQQSGVKTTTVRYYERQGILESTNRSESGYRLYSEADLQRLKFIINAKTLGFTLVEINELLVLKTKKITCRSQVKNQTLQKIHSVENKIAGLQEMLESLKSMYSECQRGASKSGCPIIETISNIDKDAS